MHRFEMAPETSEEKASELKESRGRFYAALKNFEERTEKMGEKAILEKTGETLGISSEEVTKRAKAKGMWGRIADFSVRRERFIKRVRAAALMGLLSFAPLAEVRAAEPTADEEFTVAQMYKEAEDGLEGRLGEEWMAEWKYLARHGSSERFFLLASTDARHAKLLGYAKGNDRHASVDGEKFIQVVERERSEQKIRIIGAHNHPLTLIAEVVGSDDEECAKWRGRCGIKKAERKILERQINAMREEKIPYLYHPPSGGDIFQFLLSATAVLPEAHYHMIGAVADTRGMWEFSVDGKGEAKGGWTALRIIKMLREGKRDAIPAPIWERFILFAGFDGRYNHLQAAILAPYSEEAFKKFEAGDDSLIKKESRNKEELIGDLIKETKKMGIDISFTSYEELEKTIPEKPQKIFDVASTDGH